MSDALAWKPDWAEARRAFVDWWEHRGLAVAVTAPRDEPWERLPAPSPSVSPETLWLDVEYRVASSLRQMANTYHGGVAAPIFNADVGGPGSLGLFLGCEGHPAPTTVWYSPCIEDPDAHPPLRFSAANVWWQRHVAAMRRGREESRGRFLVGCPDLVENLDTLAQLREPQRLLMDMIERPGWVKDRLAEINAAFYESYEGLWPWLCDPWGGSAFRAFGLWGPGKTVKVQCDLSCTIGAEMFREFVVPPLAEQCAWLDYSMYHLDGTQAVHHLPALLEIEALDAIQWTPQSGLPGGGAPCWYDLYRRIKAGGKSVQAINVRVDEVEPLIEAVGPEGMLIMARAKTEAEARALLRRLGWSGA